MNGLIKIARRSMIRHCLMLIAYVHAVSALPAEPLLYDGFGLNAESSMSRSGWVNDWGVFEGSALQDKGDLSIAGFDSAEGLIALERDTVTLCQLGAGFEGTVYGSFRFSCKKLSDDSMIGIAFFEPDVTTPRPDLARLALLVKGWRSDLGALSALGSKLAVEGVPIEVSETYLVLFKLVEQVGREGSMTFWLCNRKQAEHFASVLIDETLLNQADLGSEAEQISQRRRMNIKASKTPIIPDGAVLSLLSRFGSEVTFDEIRISDQSLSQAAGLPIVETEKTRSIPYITQ